MSRPIRIVVDCSTGVTSEIELTDQEIQEMEALQAQEELNRQQREAEEAAKAAAKASAEEKLAALGLTPEEIAAL
jgi:hypothetical protein